MDGWNWWDFALWSAFGYVAVVVLVRLMLARRDLLIADVRRQMEEQKRRQKKLRSKAAAPRGRQRPAA